MNVLFAASEITPVIKSGGLADVVGALPKFLSAQGINVRIIIPEYPQLKPGAIGNTEVVARFNLELSQRTVQVTVTEGRLPNSDIKLYLLNLSEGLTAPVLYPTPKQGDQDRFPLFSKAVLQWLQTESSWQPDIIHVHDWMTGLIPFLVNQQKLPYKTIITIHNLAYQGVFSREYLLKADITPPSRAQTINLLKTGIQYATKVNTVSPTYAKEVMTRQYGYHLEATMRSRSKDFCGILNGIDYFRYSPYEDKALTQTYTMQTVIEGKKANKQALLKEVKLKQENKPLFGVVTRIDGQKGLDLVESLVRETAFIEHAQLVILGTGSKELERKLARLAKKHAGQFSLLLRFDEGLAHRIYAASDFFFVPSKFEPCGLSQMISMKYGTLPIVRRTGGLADTVIDVVQNPAKGTGLVFDEFDYQSLATAANHALDLYHDKPNLFATIEQAMRQDFSWSKSAQEYVSLYKKALTARPVKSKK